MDYGARWYDPPAGRFTQPDPFSGWLDWPKSLHKTPSEPPPLSEGVEVMPCQCSAVQRMTGNEAVTATAKYLEVIQADAQSWRGLYLCRHCGTYWEESFTADRFGGSPTLQQMTKPDVAARWRI